MSDMGPSRPTHPDMERLVEIVNTLDAMTESGAQSVRELLAEVGDPGSLTYMAIQRAMRLSAATGLSVEGFATAWIEGVVVGAELVRVRLREAGN